jgi:thiol-disulfide isomerase/thioredoxin
MAADLHVDATKYFDPRADFFRRHFEKGLDYDAYVATGKEQHQARWREMEPKIALDQEQRTRVAGLDRRVNLLVLSGTWCGDCIRQVPILRRIEEAAPALTLRILDRDESPELRDELRLNGAAKVPVAVFLSEDFFEVSRYGDRSLAAYRAMARSQLGPACPIGPGPLDEDEIRAGIAEWVNEFERVELLLRLSPHLRQRHGD